MSSDVVLDIFSVDECEEFLLVENEDDDQIIKKCWSSIDTKLTLEEFKKRIYENRSNLNEIYAITKSCVRNAHVIWTVASYLTGAWTFRNIISAAIYYVL